MSGSARWLRQHTPYTDELLELEVAMTSDERSNWQQYHMQGFAPGDSMARYEERLLATVRARELTKRMRAQQPAMLEAEPARHQYGKPAEPRVGQGGAIKLPGLKALNGSLTPRPAGGRTRERQRYDVEGLKRDNPVPQYLARRGIAVRGGKTRCFVHGSRGDECMAVYADHVHCFSCGFTGSIIDIAMHLDGTDFLTACADLGANKVRELAPWIVPARPEPEARTEIGNRDLVPLVERAHRDLMAQATPLARQAGAYLRSRGFDDQDWACFRLGIIGKDVPNDLLPLTGERTWPDGRTERRPAQSWRERITVPYLDGDGNVVHVKARLFLMQTRPLQPGEKEPLKYLNPAGVATRLFGFDAMKPTGDILLVEGEIDALSVMASFTSSVIRASRTSRTPTLRRWPRAKARSTCSWTPTARRRSRPMTHARSTPGIWSPSCATLVSTCASCLRSPTTRRTT